MDPLVLYTPSVPKVLLHLVKFILKIRHSYNDPLFIASTNCSDKIDVYIVCSILDSEGDIIMNVGQKSPLTSQTGKHFNVLLNRNGRLQMFIEGNCLSFLTMCIEVQYVLTAS